MDDMQWVDKYKPKSLNDIVGNKMQIDKMIKWLKVFNDNSLMDTNFRNGLLISGPPGIGKTSTAHIILKEAGFDVIEFNASELRTSKSITEKLDSIISGKSIKMMFVKNIKTAIIMDELDGIESRKECSVSDITEYINYSTNKHENKIKQENKKNKIKTSKKSKLTIVNKNPIICICNNVNKSVNPILNDVIHIKFEPPTDYDIYCILKKIRDGEKLNINDGILNILVPYCQADIRRAVYIMQHLESYMRYNELDNKNILELIEKIGLKDVDIHISKAIDNIFIHHNISIDELIQSYYADQNFIPFIVHENFITFINNNTHNTLIEKIDLCIEYYTSLIQSQMIKNNVFGNWHLNEYIAMLSCVAPNTIIKKAKLKDSISTDGFEKSALISKYNYRYYNLKSINHICKKLDLDIKNFQVFALFVIYSVFVDRNFIDIYIKHLKTHEISFKEFEKLMKLSSVYDNYAKKYTKKMQKELNKIFDNINI